MTIFYPSLYLSHLQYSFDASLILSLFPTFQIWVGLEVFPWPSECGGNNSRPIVSLGIKRLCEFPLSHGTLLSSSEWSLGRLLEDKRPCGEQPSCLSWDHSRPAYKHNPKHASTAKIDRAVLNFVTNCICMNEPRQDQNCLARDVLF